MRRWKTLTHFNKTTKMYFVFLLNTLELNAWKHRTKHITNLLYYLGNHCSKFPGQLLRSALNGRYSCSRIAIFYRFDDYLILFLHIRLPLNNDMILLRFTWLKKWLITYFKLPSSLKHRLFLQSGIRSGVWKWSGYKVKRSWFPFIFRVSVWAVLTIITDGIVLTWTFNISLT